MFQDILRVIHSWLGNSWAFTLIKWILAVMLPLVGIAGFAARAL